MQSKAAFWPRTTYVGKLMNSVEILQIAEMLSEIGYVGEYLVQNFLKSSGTRAIDVAGLEEPDISELEPILDSIPSGISIKLEWR